MQTDVNLRRYLEKALNRKLRRTDVIHHIDFNHSNNDFTNLTIISVAEHVRVHRNAMYRHLVKLVTVAQLIEEAAMLENIGKILDVIEDLITKVDTNDPKEADGLAEVASRMESLAMEIKDRTETQ